jgi:hypothetical protein
MTSQSRDIAFNESLKSYCPVVTGDTSLVRIRHKESLMW